MWNAESPKNLQQTKAEKVGNSESIGDSDKFPDALQLSSSTITMALGLDGIGRSTSIAFPGQDQDPSDETIVGEVTREWW